MELKLINFIFCFSLNPLEPCPLPQEEQYIVTMMTIATTIPIIHVQILTLVENEQSIFDMMFINHHLLSQSSTILLVQILTLVEKDAKERLLKFQASSPESYFYVYRCRPLIITTSTDNDRIITSTEDVVQVQVHTSYIPLQLICTSHRYKSPQIEIRRGAADEEENFYFHNA